jgi:hypothetical protein
METALLVLVPLEGLMMMDSLRERLIRKKATMRGM